MTKLRDKNWYKAERLRAVFFDVPEIVLTGDFEKDYHTMGKRAEALAQLVLDTRAERDALAAKLKAVRELALTSVDHFTTVSGLAYEILDRCT